MSAPSSPASRTACLLIPHHFPASSGALILAHTSAPLAPGCWNPHVAPRRADYCASTSGSLLGSPEAPSGVPVSGSVCPAAASGTLAAPSGQQVSSRGAQAPGALIAATALERSCSAARGADG